MFYLIAKLNNSSKHARWTSYVLSFEIIEVVNSKGASQLSRKIKREKDLLNYLSTHAVARLGYFLYFFLYARSEYRAEALS